MYSYQNEVKFDTKSNFDAIPKVVNFLLEKFLNKQKLSSVLDYANAVFMIDDLKFDVLENSRVGILRVHTYKIRYLGLK